MPLRGQCCVKIAGGGGGGGWVGGVSGEGGAKSNALPSINILPTKWQTYIACTNGSIETAIFKYIIYAPSINLLKN